YGKDEPVRNSAVATRVRYNDRLRHDRASDRLEVAAERDELVRRRSLERIGLYAEELAASNNWVISGDRTADGKALLANDPHLDATAPGVWYLTHLTSPTHRVSGVTIPGVPAIVLGHNEYIAWGATNVGPDVQDLYAETFDASGKYATPSGAQRPVVRKEVIKVRSNPLKTDTEDVSMEVTETRNGPIIVEDGGKRFALRWTALDPASREFEAFYYMNRAKDWNEFTKALRLYVGATQNFVYADVKGHIGWHVAGKIPIRRTGYGDLPYDGATTEGDWTGVIPFDELPHLYDPPSGFIVTANQRAVGTDYKYPQYLRDYAAPWRARRIYELLEKDKKVTIDRVGQIQHDVFNRPVKTFAAEIVRTNAADPGTLDLLRKWDGHMTPDSKAALIANETRSCVGAKVAAENPGLTTYMIVARIIDRGRMNRQPNPWLPRAYADYGSLIRSCFDQVSTSDMPKKYGTDKEKWVWGLVSKASFRHPLAAAPLIGAQFATPTPPIAGSRETPNVASFVSMRHIATPGNWDATRHVIPLGQSGDPKSAFFKDQFEAWSNGTPVIFPFTAKAVEAATKVTMVLRPRK
ncbi:MAG TPA: penicillin acylase family protein, partial [Pyrinomonadaceae bacterium]|nr:penicillin acylase family protein [Pyrinomonadaceae bacterium]